MLSFKKIEMILFEKMFRDIIYEMLKKFIKDSLRLCVEKNVLFYFALFPLDPCLNTQRV